MEGEEHGTSDLWWEGLPALCAHAARLALNEWLPLKENLRRELDASEGAVSPALQVAALTVCVALWAQGRVALGGVVAAWQLFSLSQEPMADICSLVSFYVATRANLDLLRALDGEAAEPSGFEALVTPGEKDVAAAAGGTVGAVARGGVLARVGGALWATPERAALRLPYTPQGEEGRRGRHALGRPRRRGRRRLRHPRRPPRAHALASRRSFSPAPRAQREGPASARSSLGERPKRSRKARLKLLVPA